MSGSSSNEQMLNLYLFETTQNIEQLENCILDMEKSNGYTKEAINEIFRIMHTMKGSSAMMMFHHIANLAHTMEDLFYYIREEKPTDIDTIMLNDIVLEGVDFIKIELEKIKEQDYEDGDCSSLMAEIKDFLEKLKYSNAPLTQNENPVVIEKQQFTSAFEKSDPKVYRNFFKATLYFDDGCEMENIRAYTITHNIKQFTDEFYHIPVELLEHESSVPYIREKGFTIYLKANESYTEIKDFFEQTIFLKTLELTQLKNDEEWKDSISSSYSKDTISVEQRPHRNQRYETGKESITSSQAQSMISVNVEKLDMLMDLMGEMVIAEALVVQNQDLSGLKLDNFHKAARQLHKITGELQDVVMSIRMIPLAATFQKMYRLVRDMNRHLDKQVELMLIGENTEVDKNILEHISDPLMHLVRNSIDHGIESAEEREALGKPQTGKIILEAKNSGSDVLIQIKDDGRGLNKEKILEKAEAHGLLQRPGHEMSEREIYHLICLPGFSTREEVSEYSGRGVGMDVVTKNIEAIGGSVLIDSLQGQGTVITLKIPLTLAIIDGMNVKVGASGYTIPITVIKESFQPKADEIITDPEGNEMILVRGKCYPILRLHKIFDVSTEVMQLSNGILIMIEQDDKSVCLFAEELLGQQQVVVKTLPDFIKYVTKMHGISGCTLLGDGSISLIIDIASLLNR